MDEPKGRILIVDDTEAILLGMTKLLTNAGFHIESANRAAAGLEKFRVGAFDLVVVDYRMPDMNGREFIEEVKRDEKLRSVPIVVMTASVLHGEECLVIGADYFLPKPTEIDKLMEIARKECRRAV